MTSVTKSGEATAMIIAAVTVRRKNPSWVIFSTLTKSAYRSFRKFATGGDRMRGYLALYCTLSVFRFGLAILLEISTLFYEEDHCFSPSLIHEAGRIRR